MRFGVLRRLLVVAALVALFAPMLAALSVPQIARADEDRPATYWDESQGVEIPGELYMVWWFRDGKATRMEMYNTREQAEEAFAR